MLNELDKDRHNSARNVERDELIDPQHDLVRMTGDGDNR